MRLGKHSNFRKNTKKKRFFVANPVPPIKKIEKIRKKKCAKFALRGIAIGKENGKMPF